MFANVVRTGRRIAAEFSEKNIPFMAAGIAYNAFVSLAPLLLVLVLVVSLVGGGLEDRIVELAYRSMPTPMADVVAEIFRDENGTPGASIVGLVVLVWGSLKIFRGLDTAFSEIYETAGENSFLDALTDGVVVLVAILFAVLATVAVTAVFARYADRIPYVGFLTPVVLVFGLVVAFLPMYYRFPDSDVDLRYVLPGVLVAAVGWAAFQSVFQVYLAFTGGGSESFFGGVLVVVTWLYFSGLVLLLGAVINAVLGGDATGEAGGVGEGAVGYETERETDLTRRELSAYLEMLRSDLTGAPANARRSVEAGGHRRYPLPDGTVTVIERSQHDDEDGTGWSVAFRWTGPEDSPDGQSASRSSISATSS